MMNDLISQLESTLRAEGHWPPPDGWNPTSKAWTDLLTALPFIPFRLHPLPANVQAFLDVHPDLDTGELDAVSDLLERLFEIPASHLVILDGDRQFSVFANPAP